ncbi:MAG: ECF transporter S component [Clostridiales bacterium]|nr:ECF transporter S component [Clostridiales bacterium]
MKSKFNIRYLTKISMLTAIAVVLMYLEFPLPIFPAFLKIDLSDLPALLGGFALGPLAGVIIQLLKNIIHFIVKNDGTGGIGNLANFIVGIALVVPAALIYLKKKSIKTAILGMIVGIFSMAIIAALANYFILWPLYVNLIGKEAILAMAQVVNKNVTDVGSYILYALVPFNALKGIAVCLIAAFIYKPLSSVLHK